MNRPVDKVEIFDATGRKLGEVERWRICPTWMLSPNLVEEFQRIADDYRLGLDAALIFAGIMAAGSDREPSESDLAPGDGIGG